MPIFKRNTSAAASVKSTRHESRVFVTVVLLLGLLVAATVTGYFVVRQQHSLGEAAIANFAKVIGRQAVLRNAEKSIHSIEHWRTVLEEQRGQPLDIDLSEAMTRFDAALAELDEVAEDSTGTLKFHAGEIRQLIAVLSDASEEAGQESVDEVHRLLRLHLGEIRTNLKHLSLVLSREGEANRTTMNSSIRSAVFVAIAALILLLIFAGAVAWRVFQAHLDFRKHLSAQSILEGELRRHKNRLEGEVVESRDRLLSAIDMIDNGFALVDAEDRIVLANTKLKEFYPGIDALLEEQAEVSEFVEKHELCIPEAESKDADDGSGASTEQMLSDGRWLRVQRSASSDGGYIVLYEDVTHYKTQEFILKDQADLFKEALDKQKEMNDMQRQFIAIASHEFRTPLAIIESSVRRLLRKKENLSTEELLKRTEKINSAVARMIKLMENTLQVSRMDAGKIEVQAEACDLRVLIRSACVRLSELAPEFKFHLNLNRIPPAVEIDADAIDQVITNLLSNAVKYSADRRDVEVKGWCEHGRICISVRDYGLGIDEDDQAKLFGRFFRAKTAAGIEGTGIGLNLVKGLVEAHGGSVACESRPGEGSTFTITLPVAGAEEAVAV